MTCPNETTLNEHVDEALSDDAARIVRQHVASCAECSVRISRITSLKRGLAGIAMDTEPEHDLWPAIARRTARRTASPALLRLAAGVALLVTGFAAGTLLSNAAPEPTPYPDDVIAAAAEVQRTGSAHVAALANLAALAEAVSDTAMARAARDVAFASLRGASLELIRLAPAEGSDLYISAVTNHASIRSAPAAGTPF